MKVIDEENQAWYLIENRNRLFIDVNCNYSFLGFGRLIELNEFEMSNYSKGGKKYLNDLAKDIQYYALSLYNDRNIKDVEIIQSVNSAIKEYNS